MRIHHIGYLVEDIKSAQSEMLALGFAPLGEITIDEGRRIYVVFMDNNGYVIELIQPIDEQSPVYGLRKKHKNSPYHICYETSSIDTEIAKLCDSNGSVLVSEPTSASAISQTAKVAFIMSAHIGMLELVQLGDDTIC